uniref:Uncharacterized protein n=1 Tax=viral metagenome TaxID=1070528 RepID=A0A6M3JQ63_9ZZZZ
MPGKQPGSEFYISALKGKIKGCSVGPSDKISHLKEKSAFAETRFTGYTMDISGLKVKFLEGGYTHL